MLETTRKVQSTSCIRRISDPGDMVEIFEPDCSILVWERLPNEKIIEHFSNNPIEREIHIREILSKNNYSISDLLSDYSELFLLPELVMDLELLTEMYCDLLDLEEFGFRFSNLRSQMCPKFHVDFVGIRMLCTYFGPGTEYLERNSENLEALVIQDDQEITKNVQSVNPMDVILLKGERWEGNEKKGAIHRSPNVSIGENRIFLSLDLI
jgi:hypothetical protein